MVRVLVLPKRSALVRWELNPLIPAGAFLRSLPGALTSGTPARFLTTLVTATSATGVSLVPDPAVSSCSRCPHRTR